MFEIERNPSFSDTNEKLNSYLILDKDNFLSFGKFEKILSKLGE